MEIENRQAALCVFCHEGRFLVAEIIDPVTGVCLHRPPGGGIEDGETPEQAVVREVQEELGVTVGPVRMIGTIDHVWHWKGRELRERAWIFVPDPPGGPWPVGAVPQEIVEADGGRHRTLWRSPDAPSAMPPLCPGGLADLLRPILRPFSGGAR